MGLVGVKKNLKGSFKEGGGSVQGLPVGIKKSKSFITKTPVTPQDDLYAFSLPLIFGQIDVLFPSTEGPFARPDKRDVWMLEKDMLKRAGRRWSLSLKAQHGADPWEENAMGDFFEELPDLLRMNLKGEVDVDDYLYLTMMQWAKLCSISVARSSLKVPLVGKNNPYSMKEVNKKAEVEMERLNESERKLFEMRDEEGGVDGKEVADVQSTIVRMTERYKVEESAFTLTKTPYSATFLNQFVESAYKSIDRSVDGLQQAANDLSISDPGNQAVIYLRMITQFEAGGVTVKRSKALQKLMKSAVLWDLNTVGRSPEYEHEGPLTSMSEDPDNDDPLQSPKSSPKKKSLNKGPTPPTGDVSGMSGVAVKGDSIAAHRLFSAKCIGMAVVPDISLVSAREAFLAYQGPISKMIVKIAEKQPEPPEPQVENDEDEEDKVFVPQVYVNPDIPRLMEIITTIMSEFELKLPWIERIYSPPTQSPKPGTPTDILKENERRAEEAATCWSLLLTLICTVSELGVLSDEELPRDPWEWGKKIYLERAGVYSIPLQTKIV
mmetsp:Transcript_12109/g.11747  ORF Transcript_12109/g.11747 Transcript_12109/m.11747 type:complete len:550 (+) Transcript_12109:2-1651(+)